MFGRVVLLRSQMRGLEVKPVTERNGRGPDSLREYIWQWIEAYV